MTDHESRECPACVEGSIPVEPYEDFAGESVECSRCWDKKKICVTCESKNAEEEK